MQGLTILGTDLEADELMVCAAVCRALQAAGRRPVAHVPVAAEDASSALAVLAEAAGQPTGTLTAHRVAVAASPLVAARLAGFRFEAPALLEGAAAAARGDVLLAAVGGGILAPLTPRYAVRDFAREFGAPALLAAPAGPRMVNDLRLSVEAARAGGVRVVAVVLTRWPDPPGRVLLEERKALEDLLDVGVQALPATARSVADLGAAADPWPVEGWLEPPSDPPARRAEELVLEPYTAWPERPLGDPRATPRRDIMNGLLEITGAEGPLTATRLYSLYNRAAGGRKLTSVARAPLSSATYWLAQERRIVLTRERDIAWQGDDLVRLPDSPAVRVRELGPRTLEEAPLDEIAELVRRLRATRGISDATQLKRAVLAAYGLLRLTSRADEYLGLAVDLASD